MQSGRSARPLIAKVGRHGWSTFVFLFSKSSVFFAPLLLSNLLGISEYGTFEYAMGFAAVLAVVFAMGLPGAVPYFLLQKKDAAFAPAFDLHIILVGLGIATLTAIHFWTSLNETVFLTLLIAGVFTVQTLYAAQFKTAGAPARASWSESGAYLIWLFLGLFSLILGWRLELPLIAFALGGYAVFLVGMALVRLLPQLAQPGLSNRYRTVLGFGFPLIFTSVFMMLLVSSGRLLVGSLLSMEDVGIYSFVFRICAAVVLVHQLVSTIFFRKLYVSEVRKLDLYFLAIFLLILSISLLLYALAPTVLLPYFSLMANVYSSYMPVYLAIAIQMVFWVGTALLENVVARHNLGAAMSKVLTGLVVAFVTVILLLANSNLLSLLLLVRIHMVFIFLTLLGQVWLLRRHGLQFVRMPLAGAFVLAGYTVATIGW